jgi:hypothetical protein
MLADILAALPQHIAESLRLSGRCTLSSVEAPPRLFNQTVQNQRRSLMNICVTHGKPKAYRNVLRQSRKAPRALSR